MRPDAGLRLRVELAIAALIDLLDALDGDTDREPDDLDEEHDGAEPLNCSLMGSVAA